MALSNRALFTTSTNAAIPHIKPTQVAAGIFADVGGTPTYKKGTLLSWDEAGVDSAGHWVVWDGNGGDYSAEVDGVVWPNDVTLVSGSEVMGSVMTAGEFDYNDILTINVTDGGYGDATELKTALRKMALRQKNLRVRNLDLTPE